jgi:hypothetical protein
MMTEFDDTDTVSRQRYSPQSSAFLLPMESPPPMCLSDVLAGPPVCLIPSIPAAPPFPNHEVVLLDVGGARFKTSKETLTSGM